MTDCPDGDIRDLLPDYVHDRLGPSERAEVAAHVASCALCAAEVELLGAARRALSGATPYVDTARIVAALPAPPRTGQRPAIVRAGATRSPRSRTLASWRIAAVIAMVAIGGGSFAVIRGITGGSQPPAVVVSQPTPKVAVQPSASSEEVSDNNPVAIPDGGRMGDLSDDDVQSLLNDIDNMDGVPDANPQPAVPAIRGAGTL